MAIGEFTGLLKCLDDTLSALPAPTPTIVLMGDFNFNSKCIEWNLTEEGLLVPIVGNHSECVTEGGKQDRLQAQHLIDLADKHCLLQEVDQQTHLIEILDLIFSNNSDLIGGIFSEEWRTFTDHKLLVAHTTYQLAKTDHQAEEQYLCETGRRYSALDYHKAPWEAVSEELSKVDWEPMEEIAATCPSKGLEWFHEKVLGVLEKLVPMKKKRSRSRPKMHRMRRLLWKRLGKVKKALKTATSTEKVADLLQKMWQLE